MKTTVLSPVSITDSIALAVSAKDGPDGKTLCRSLRGLGYPAERSANPQDILKLAENALITCLVILDSVPFEVSRRLCEELRRAGRRIAILVLHSDYDPERTAAWIEAGADHCVLQPVRVAQLSLQIQAINRRRNGNLG